MENVISIVDGYSFFLDEHIIGPKRKKLPRDFIVFETGKAMTGTQVSEELGVSRMAVSQSLKNAFKKIYMLLKKKNRHYDPFDIAVTMSEILRVSLDNETEVNKFFNLFPAEIKKEIKNHAKTRYRKCEQCSNKALCGLL